MKTIEEFNETYQSRLKACPCCGGEAAFRRLISIGSLIVTVYCKNCELTTRNFEPQLESCAVDDAIEAWNKRVGD